MPSVCIEEACPWFAGCFRSYPPCLIDTIGRISGSRVMLVIGFPAPRLLTRLQWVADEVRPGYKKVVRGRVSSRHPTRGGIV
jgi:hypothetical protein